MFTIDTSVWVNADSPAEPGQADSRALLDELFDRQLPIVVPTLLAVEVAGVIGRIRGNPELAAEMASSLFELQHLRWIPLDDAMSRQAASLAAQHRLRGADAVYAAVAVAHGCSLVSLDQEHLTRLSSVISVLRPFDARSKIPLR